MTRYTMVIIVSAVTGLFAQQLTKVEISINQDSIDVLEADPFSNRDVHGKVTIDDKTVYDTVEIHYRGAYMLSHLLKTEHRNWKLKFKKKAKYHNRREWNFNYENHLRQKMMYDLFAAAGVAVPSARHVELYVNGVRHGIYLEYEDPDNKDWLKDAFGDKSGDLFKAAQDLPGEPVYFAHLTDLGDNNSDYFYHYNKKTNKDGEDADDYSRLISFIKMLNHTPDESFPDSLEKYFEVDSFIRYLVVANFAVHWDSYPTRPKNFWLYHNPSSGKWSFVPWDLDLTFQLKWAAPGLLLDTDLHIFYQMKEYETFDGYEEEGTERPLMRRMMQYPHYRDRYIAEYKSALDTYLDMEFIHSTVDSLTGIIRNDSNGAELEAFEQSVDSLKDFVSKRYLSVKQQLDTLTIGISREKNESKKHTAISIMSNGDLIQIKLISRETGMAFINLVDIGGRKMKPVFNGFLKEGVNSYTSTVSDLAAGVYVVSVKLNAFTETGMFVLK